MFNMEDGHSSLVEGVGRVTCPVLVLGVTSDVLFPIEQQREMVALLKEAGKKGRASVCCLLAMCCIPQVIAESLSMNYLQYMGTTRFY